MGGLAKPARPRLAHRLPGVATPALFGVAAAVAFANVPTVGLPTAQAPAHHTAATAAVQQSDAAATTAWLLSALRLTANQPTVNQPTVKQSHALPAKYTVKSGDTLSIIAKRLYQNSDFWPALYWANHSKIQYASELRVGQVLTVPVKPTHVPRPPSVLRPAPAPAPSTSAAGSETSAPVQAASTSTASGSSFQSCVIARESGGNSQVMNSSGHYGLYQFSASTWAEYGGSPADFGHASVAEQNQVFDNAIAAGGQSNWSAYDGC